MYWKKERYMTMSAKILKYTKKSQLSNMKTFIDSLKEEFLDLKVLMLTDREKYIDKCVEDGMLELLQFREKVPTIMDYGKAKYEKIEVDLLLLGKEDEVFELAKMLNIKLVIKSPYTQTQTMALLSKMCEYPLEVEVC